MINLYAELFRSLEIITMYFRALFEGYYPEKDSTVVEEVKDRIRVMDLGKELREAREYSDKYAMYLKEIEACPERADESLQKMITENPANRRRKSGM